MERLGPAPSPHGNRSQTASPRVHTRALWRSTQGHLGGYEDGVVEPGGAVWEPLVISWILDHAEEGLSGRIHDKEPGKEVSMHSDDWRISRSTYWLNFVLPIAGIQIVGAVLDVMLGFDDPDEIGPVGGLLFLLLARNDPAMAQNGHKYLESRRNNTGAPAWFTENRWSP